MNKLEAIEKVESLGRIIEQLTKERDSIKAKAIQTNEKLYSMYNESQEQLQAEKQKVKELVRNAYIDALKEKKHMDYDEPFTEGEKAMALIHADDYCKEIFNF